MQSDCREVLTDITALRIPVKHPAVKQLLLLSSSMDVPEAVPTIFHCA